MLRLFWLFDYYTILDEFCKNWEFCQICKFVNLWWYSFSDENNCKAGVTLLIIMITFIDFKNKEFDYFDYSAIFNYRSICKTCQFFEINKFLKFSILQIFVKLFTKFGAFAIFFRKPIRQSTFDSKMFFDSKIL